MERMEWAERLDFDGSPLQSAIQLSSSIVPHVILRTEFWFMLGVHLMTWGAYQSGWFHVENYVAAAISVDWIDLKILTVLSIFFLAFHVNQCFQQYLQIYNCLKRLLASVHDFAGYARLFFDGQLSAYQHLSSRWLTSCTLLAIEELQHGKVEDEIWRKYVDQSLVRRSEVEFLRSLPLRPRLLAMSHMTAELSKSQLKDEEFLEVLKSILHYKECHQELLDLTMMKVPFQYKHLLSITVFLNLLFLAYGMALSESTMAPGIFIVMDLVLLGMLDVAEQLWNPFRSKSLEFTLDQWKEDFRDGLRTILNYQHAGANEQWKHELQEEYSANPNLGAYPQHVKHLLEGKNFEEVRQEAPAASPEPASPEPAPPAPSAAPSAPGKSSEYVDDIPGLRPLKGGDGSPSMPPLETLQ